MGVRLVPTRPRLTPAGHTFLPKVPLTQGFKNDGHVIVSRIWPIRMTKKRGQVVPKEEGRYAAPAIKVIAVGRSFRGFLTLTFSFTKKERAVFRVLISLHEDAMAIPVQVTIRADFNFQGPARTDVPVSGWRRSMVLS